MFTEPAVATVEDSADMAKAKPAAPAIPAPAVALVDRKSFAAALAIADRAIAGRNTIPVLAAVMLTAAPGGLRVAGTDLDFEMVAHAAGSADSHFAIALPAAAMLKAVKAAKASEMVEITATWTANGDCSATLDFAGLKVTLPGWPVADWPAHANHAPIVSFDIPSGDLLRLFAGVAFAMSTEETRYYLNGAFLHTVARKAGGADETVLRSVATDGHRLSQVEVSAPAGCHPMPGIIVPRLAVEELARLLGAKGAPAVVSVSILPNAEGGREAAQVSFRIGQVEAWTKLIDGTFPDYVRVIPRGNERRLEFDPAAMADAIGQVEAVAGKTRAMRLEMSEGGPARLSMGNPDAKAEVSTPATYTDAPEEDPTKRRPEFCIGFNSHYLRDMCGRLDGPAEMMLCDEGGPALIRMPSDPARLFVLMPMRV